MELPKQRQIDQYLWDDELTGGKALFVSGPRQVGKTTYARGLVANGRAGRYVNCDNPVERRRLVQEPFFYLQEQGDRSPFLVVLDEVHKRPRWRDLLKGIIDSVEPSVRLLVTGSARLDLFRRVGDSLVGRYFLFHMLPLSVAELLGADVSGLWLGSAADWKRPWASLEERLTGTRVAGARAALETLLQLGGFPEPLARGSERFQRRWLREYLSLLLHQDLRDLSNIKDLETVENVVELLPERIGSPLSVAAVAGDVGSSQPTVASYLAQLERLWLLFMVRPWSARLNRTVRKERKCYFTNWLYASDDARRFENYLATSLLKACTVWTELGYGVAGLWYVRNFDGHEVDFLLTLDKKPVLLLEAKLSETAVARPARTFAAHLSVPLLQVVRTPGILKREAPDVFVLSAERLLAVVP